MTVQETILKIIEAFSEQYSDISYHSKECRRQLPILLKELLSEESLTDNELKLKSDLLIVGTIIFILTVNDVKFGHLGNGNFLYPLSHNEINEGNPQSANWFDSLTAIGKKALIDKSIPFTGNIDTLCLAPVSEHIDTRQKIFPSLQAAFDENHFKQYGLNTDPATMDTTKRSAPAIEARKKQIAKQKENEKWRRPFGHQLISVEGLYSYIGENLMPTVSQRKSEIQSQIDRQNKEYLQKIWKWRGQAALTILAGLFFLPSLFLTVPLLINQYKSIEKDYAERVWVKNEFTIDEYENIREKRNNLKALFNTEKTSNHLAKPKKVCIALDKNNKEVFNRSQTKKIVMLSDKAQAKRWNLGFLQSIQQDEDKGQEQYNETIKQSVTYISI